MLLTVLIFYFAFQPSNESQQNAVDSRLPAIILLISAPMQPTIFTVETDCV